MYLFENEYDVPLLSAEFAAMMGTAIELFFPVLLALGLAGRFGAFVLFAFNIMAVISYPDCWASWKTPRKGLAGAVASLPARSNPTIP